MSKKKRPENIVLEKKFLESFEKYLGNNDHHKKRWKDFCKSLLRSPKIGYVAPKAPDYIGVPFHVGDRSFFVVYWYDNENIYCVEIHPVPSGPFGDD